MTLRKITLLLGVLLLTSTAVHAQDKAPTLRTILIAPVQVNQTAQKLGISSDLVSIYLNRQLKAKNSEQRAETAPKFYSASPMLNRKLNLIAKSRDRTDSLGNLISNLRYQKQYRDADHILFTYFTVLETNDRLCFDIAIELRDRETLACTLSYDSQSPSTAIILWRKEIKDLVKNVNILIAQNQAAAQSVSPGKPFLGFIFSKTDKISARIVNIANDSPAHKADIRPGDLIESFNDKAILTQADFLSQLQQLELGQKVKVRLYRNHFGLDKTLTVEPCPSEIVLAPKHVRGTIGVTVRPVFGGVKITGLLANQPAQIAGLKVGDVILQINGQDTPNVESFKLALDPCKPGDVATVTVRRDQLQHAVKVVLSKFTEQLRLTEDKSK